ncbi:MAG: 4-hydroxyphenylacetate 3-hydroxylase N-terminal domain-containing protein [Chloroflexota bacterium]
MAIRTPKEYMASLNDGRVIYVHGKKYTDVTGHPLLRLALERCLMDYVMAQETKYKDLVIEKDDNGEPYHFTLKPPTSAADLLRRRAIEQTAARTLGGKASGSKHTGPDGLHAVTAVGRLMDKQIGTSYSERVEAFRKELKRIDAAIALGMTAIKGDRSLRPSEQKQHKDFYVRMTDKTKDGIIVNGALAHISHAPFCNYIIVLPCRSMKEADKDYAVSFAVSPNEKGVTLIHPRGDYFEEGNYFDYPHTARLGYSDCIVTFENVFIPNERVFLCGEWQYAAQTAYVFSNFHRQDADAYKVALLETLVGTAILMAEYNGIEKDSVIQEKLSWLVYYAETAEALGRAAAQNPAKEPVTGYIYADPLLSNCAKFFYADNYHQALKFLLDITGGIAATIPSSKDYENKEIRPLLEKYLAGKDGVPTEHRIRAIKLAYDLANGYEQVATIHAEGSLGSQRLSIPRSADLNKYKAAAKRLAGIDDGTKHPLFSQLIKWPRPLKDIIK